jgi:hypothetical protein
VKAAQSAQQQFPNSYGIDPNQTVMGVPIGQMLQQYNQSQQQQRNPWGATPATPNAVQSGSLAALGGGIGRRAPIYNPVQPPQNGPQPVPGMPPRQFDPNMGQTVIGSEPWNPLTVGNRGSGQPINQPMATDQGGWKQNWNPDGSAGPDNPDQNARTQPMGSLQSLGLNQSGMVNLRGPDGSMKAVPQSDMAHWLSKGAVRADGGGGGGEQMVNNGWGRMVPKSEMDKFYASGGMT